MASTPEERSATFAPSLTEANIAYGVEHGVAAEDRSLAFELYHPPLLVSLRPGRVLDAARLRQLDLLEQELGPQKAAIFRALDGVEEAAPGLDFDEVYYPEE